MSDPNSKTGNFSALFKGGLVIAFSLCAGQAAWAGQGGQVGKELRQACSADYQKLCSGVQPGGGQVMACFQQNIDKLSSACQKALQDAKAAKQGSGS